MATATKARRKVATTYQTKMLIDGKWCDSQSGKTFDTINPATEEVIPRSPKGMRPISIWRSRPRARRLIRGPGAPWTPAIGDGS